MRKSSLFFLSLFAGAFPLLAPALRAQSGTPVTDPPPISPPTDPTPAPRASDPASAFSLTEATNSSGKSSGNNTVKELRFPAVDADSDGLISLSEFTTFMDAGNLKRTADAGAETNPTVVLFRGIDRDHDNFLSESEVTAYQAEQDRAKK